MQYLCSYSDTSFLKKITFEHLKNISLSTDMDKFIDYGNTHFSTSHSYTHSYIQHPPSTEQTDLIQDF